MVDPMVLGSTIASLMMNGVCCIWQQHEDDNRREQFRQDLRTEYWRQKIIDQEMELNRQHERRPPPVPVAAPSSDERRMKLLMDKKSASISDMDESARTVAVSPPIPVTPDFDGSSRTSSLADSDDEDEYNEEGLEDIAFS